MVGGIVINGVLKCGVFGSCNCYGIVIVVIVFIGYSYVVNYRCVRWSYCVGLC